MTQSQRDREAFELHLREHLCDETLTVTFPDKGATAFIKKPNRYRLDVEDSWRAYRAALLHERERQAGERREIESHIVAARSFLVLDDKDNAGRHLRDCLAALPPEEGDGDE